MWVHTNLPRFATARLTHTVSQGSQCATPMGLVHSSDYVGSGEAKMNTDIIFCHYGNVTEKKDSFILLLGDVLCVHCMYYFPVFFYCSTQRMKHSQFSQMRTDSVGAAFKTDLNSFKNNIGCMCNFLYCSSPLHLTPPPLQFKCCSNVHWVSPPSAPGNRLWTYWCV